MLGNIKHIKNQNAKFQVTITQFQNTVRKYLEEY